MTTDIENLKFPDHVHCRILVCDDSTADATLAKDLLESIGYTGVIALMDPRQVMPTLEQGAYDLLLLDLNMPHMSGLEVICQVRKRFSPAELPILVITATQASETRNAALAAGANDYLNKPIDAVETALRARNLLSIRTSYAAHQAVNQNLTQQVKIRTAKLDTLIENGLLMAATHDISRLFHHALFEGQRLLNCDAGTLYLLTDHQTLRFTMRTRGDALPSFELPLVDPVGGGTNDHYIAVHAVTHRTSVLIDDVYQETRFDVSGTKRFDAETHYRTVSMLTVPMAARGGAVVGVLQFINCKDPETGEIIPFSPDLVGLVEALAAQAAVTYENLRLIDERKAFMESLIHTIATAIDAKSPYTGRHSERVPELALMLAKAACVTTQGPLADFSFKSDDEWHEFRVGAWLHDCGKITTPEYVIDKATKLETIYNRIHEIRMRFEVLLRDAEIERLQALTRSDKAQAATANADFSRRKAQLLEDFAFIAQCNIGAESMSDAQMARVRQIGQTPWLRNFDDQLGLSNEEMFLRTREPAVPVPARERLLDDKPHHLIARGAADVLNESFGFKVEVPEHLYNLGEIYNLLVRRGTLTAEDRFKINEHMIHGIMMLERMPFPDSLKRVPEYAGTHHETLNGTGYPRRLSAAQLSVPARIMAIADIFEALTAADRPYKQPKKFSESLGILHAMKVNGQIDADLFDLFLTSGVYLQYAEKFMLPEQIDAIDISVYLGPVAA